MSTNATIIIEGAEFAKVYKHWDGYPESTLKWLEDFNSNFAEERGEDPDYKFAQLLRSSVRDGEKYNLDDSSTTGWGVLTMDDYKGDYEYTLHNDGSVTYKEG